MNNQAQHIGELNYTRTTVLAALNAQVSARAYFRGFMIDELCDGCTRLWARLEDVNHLIEVSAEKSAQPARRTSGSLAQWLLRALQAPERSWIDQILNRRFCHDQH
jgi:hypothetical protein